MIIPVILSGGSGSRLWPISRNQYPKQFLNLDSQKYTLLQQTILRSVNIDSAQSPIMICNEQHRFIAAEQFQEIGIQPQSLLLEPEGKNTAPAITMAALAALNSDEDAILLVLPADHVIGCQENFEDAVQKGIKLAQDHHLVTFGIKPTEPNTGYGYIKAGTAIENGAKIDGFYEKPDIDKAKEYYSQDNFFWNSGIFIFRADVFLQEMDTYASDIVSVCRKAHANLKSDLDFTRIDSGIFESCRSESIDYAVMEKTRHAAVIPLNTTWSDIGSWDALYEISSKDLDNGNVIQGDVITECSERNFIRSESRLIATHDVKDLIIVETDDAILVANRKTSQGIKNLVDNLKRNNRKETDYHQTIYRPWGHYKTINLQEGFQVKEIVVDPGQALSLQLHHHRAEHWIVVRGTACVTQGKDSNNPEELESFLLSEDQSTYIPLGTLHRLENPGVIPLKLIEVQTGSYLGEDDIVRLTDVYGRE